MNPALIKLRPEWCKCEEYTFHSYPANYECACGIDKHHVHCTCGRVAQVG
jgi:hypothetical protein